MTCQFCGYEFCWGCGASASRGDNHFGFMRGCGVKMMDESVKPGDGLKKVKANCCCEFLKIVGKVLLMIIAYPFFLVLYMPCSVAYQMGKQGWKEAGLCGAIPLGLIGFIIGFIMNICFIPAALLYTVLVLFVLLIIGLIMCCTCSCCRSRGQNAQAEEENRRRAEQRI